MSSKEGAMISRTSAPSVESCQGGKLDGAKCRARPVAGSSYCFFNHPEKRAERKAAQRAGGQKNKMVVLPSSVPNAKLQNADDAVKLLAQTINQVRRGEVREMFARVAGFPAI